MRKSKDETIEVMEILSYFSELLDKTYSDLRDSYKVLSNFKDDFSYQLSLSYLNLSYQSYLELRRIYHQHKLQRGEIDPFFEAYDHYKYELKSVITKDDKNTSWLSSAYDEFVGRKEETSKFINDHIENMNELNNMIEE